MENELKIENQGNFATFYQKWLNVNFYSRKTTLWSYLVLISIIVSEIGLLLHAYFFGQKKKNRKAWDPYT